MNPAPPAQLPLNRKIGPNVNQDAALRSDIQAAQGTGARDTRVKQQQVNATRQRVGVNRPDLQYTDGVTGKRVYVEYDTDPANGVAHQERILANDPDAIVILRTIR